MDRSELLACMIRAVAGCDGAEGLIVAGLADGWPLHAERIDCPVRIVWGPEDLLLPWPRAARRDREQLLPHADWVLLDGAGHYPQLDLPLETGQLIVGFTAN
jgi:pimeloyl-ACP methyl ester carboxylesterase